MTPLDHCHIIVAVTWINKILQYKELTEYTHQVQGPVTIN